MKGGGGGYLWGGGQVHVQQGVGQRGSTRTQNDRCTLRSRRLHLLKQKVHPLVVSFRVSVDGANVCGITRTNWSKPYTNSVTPRDTRTTAVRLRSRRLHPLKHQVHPFGVLFPYFREWTRYLRPPSPPPKKKTTGQNHTPTTVVVQICRVLAWRPCIIVYREA